MSGYLVEGWFAVIGPKGLPTAEVKRINAAFASAFATADVKDAMAKQGNPINVTTPEAAAAFSSARWTSTPDWSNGRASNSTSRDHGSPAYEGTATANCRAAKQQLLHETSIARP